MGSLRSLLLNRKVPIYPLDIQVKNYLRYERGYWIHPVYTGQFGLPLVFKTGGLPHLEVDHCQIEVLIQDSGVEVRFLIVIGPKTGTSPLRVVKNFPRGRAVMVERGQKYYVSSVLVYQDYANFKEKMGKHLIRTIREFTGAKGEIRI